MDQARHPCEESDGAAQTQERNATHSGYRADVPARPLTPTDALVLGYQRAFPRTPLTVGYLLVADGPAPEVQALRELVADRARDFPPLTHRIASTGRGRLAWVADVGFDPARHVHEYRLPAEPGLTGLREAVGRLSAVEISLDAPPWQLWLLHGPHHGGFTLLYRASHVWMDGTALNLVLGKLFGLSGPGSEREPPRRSPDRRPGPRAVCRATAHSLGWLARTATIGPLSAAPTGYPRHFWLEVDLARLRAISRAHAVTVNDVFLAALAGALRAWPRLGSGQSGQSGPGAGRAGRTGRTGRTGRGRLHAAMPVSTRRAAERDHVSNYLTTVRIALPHDEASVHRRVEAIRRQTVRHKRGGTPGVAERLFLGAVPAPLRPAALSTGIMSHIFALTASNPGGLTGPMEILGRPVIAALPTPPLPAGQRLAVLLGGLDGQACIGFTMDESVRDGTRLPELVEAELGALEAAAGLPHDRRLMGGTDQNASVPAPPSTSR
ncbi:wax ester/triacylglycerol synthase domain-containing protein [Parafrankia elaeagni]|uniref:wax ester/triacylglycerol synthase domain-containing protein n=1 Tax=Parafrankia elaeagni TaxID=222534 RepID=UPI00039ADF00|nr:wax ester/triacylglycerol synthase domain-containing protein [Parafrankia elaeagni]